jgi:hypothetical protein
MAELAMFPKDCWVFIVESEPLQAMTLDCLVEEFGCQRLGPASTFREAEKLLHTQRPHFALVAVDVDDELEPVTSLLDREEIVFALLAIGPANAVLDRSEKLRSRPRVQRPFHGPTLHAAMCGLYRSNLAKAIDKADWHLMQGQQRLARQLRLIEEIAARGDDTAQADALAREYARQLQTIRAARSTLTQRLAEFASNQEQS